ncbi:MAG: cytochrome C oxidase subunit IV family protein [Anaerolineales bacterium]|nr:cytochrome C oxidase subunit IV family protein [Anaerolineales bacterium]
MEPTSHPPSSSETHAHPTPATYIRIFGWLAAFTLIELFVSFMPSEMDGLKVPVLVLFAIVKASLVAMFYMHLRYDSRWYTVLLLAGVFFAVLVGRFLPLVQK